MTPPLRWGVLSTGNIARQFAQGLRGAECGKIVAVGSRRLEAARDFSRTYGFERAYGSYDQLLEDDQVEAVYLALPNSMHYEWTIKALRAGKHVLCEKPLATTVAQGEEMFDVAETHGRVLVEAFMYRSHPMSLAAKEQVDNGAIGPLRMIRTSFCFCADHPQTNIRFDRQLAGGALMDVGCYCINLSRWYAGAEPATAHAVAHFHESGVDDLVAGTLLFPSGLVTSFVCGMTVHADNTAYLCGGKGYIEIPIPWKPPVQKACYVLKQATPPLQNKQHPHAQPAPPQRIQIDAIKPLYALEADDFAVTVRVGSSPRITRSDSVGNMKVLDDMRHQIGLDFKSC